MKKDYNYTSESESDGWSKVLSSQRHQIHIYLQVEPAEIIVHSIAQHSQLYGDELNLQQIIF